MMLKDNNKNWSAMADPAIVKEICSSIKQMRLSKQMAKISKESGSSGWTDQRNQKDIFIEDIISIGHLV